MKNFFCSRNTKVNDGSYSSETSCTECGICFEMNESINLENCTHEICKNCLINLCSDKYFIKKQCPFCRIELSENDIDKYRNNEFIVEPKIRELLHRIFSKDPTWISVYGIVKSSISENEAIDQFGAIDEFYQGKIDYATMRSLCG